MSEEILRRFSHSQIEMYLQCPRKSYFRYVLGIKSPSSGALVRGRACDEAWSANLSHKIEHGQDMAENDVLEITEQEFRRIVRDEGGKDSIDWGDGTARSFLDSALAMSRAWLQRLAPRIKPAGVQVELHRTLESGRDFIGYIDWTGEFDGKPVIGDHKSGARRMAEGDAEKNLQASAYAWLKGESINFVFDRVIDTGRSVSVEAVLTTRGEADIEAYGQLVSDIESLWETGTFPTNPTSYLCSRKFCPYFERCPVGRGVVTR